MSAEVIPLVRARLVQLWLAEPVFFASRELSDTYVTEGVIGNYALAYALRWAQAPYRLQGEAVARPRYREDLSILTGKDYVLPAWPANGEARFRFERFNALSDAYWFMMTNNRVATAREWLPAWRAGERPNEFRPSNFPQAGRLRLLERGQVFQTIVLGDRDLPDYIRVGKFNSKVRLTPLNECRAELLPAGEHSFAGVINPADIPPSIRLLTYDLINMPPVPLLRHIRFHGEAWRVGDFILPAGMGFMVAG